MAIDVLRTILQRAKSLRDGGKWQASHMIDGVQTPKRPIVGEFDCGLKGLVPWIEVTLTEDGASTKLYTDVSVSGHSDVIKYGGNDVDDDDVVFSHRVRGLELRAVVEFKFQNGGKAHRYRFDATIGKLTDIA